MEEKCLCQQQIPCLYNKKDVFTNFQTNHYLFKRKKEPFTFFTFIRYLNNKKKYTGIYYWLQSVIYKDFFWFYHLILKKKEMENLNKLKKLGSIRSIT